MSHSFNTADNVLLVCIPFCHSFTFQHKLQGQSGSYHVCLHIYFGSGVFFKSLCDNSVKHSINTPGFTLPFIQLTKHYICYCLPWSTKWMSEGLEASCLLCLVPVLLSCLLVLISHCYISRFPQQEGTGNTHLSLPLSVHHLTNHQWSVEFSTPGDPVFHWWPVCFWASLIEFNLFLRKKLSLMDRNIIRLESDNDVSTMNTKKENGDTRFVLMTPKVWHNQMHSKVCTLHLRLDV